MKNIKHFAILALMPVVILCAGCSNSKDSNEGIITVYGTVTNTSGEPISGATVTISIKDFYGDIINSYNDIRLVCSGGSSVTGSDGVYEIPAYCSFENAGFERYQTEIPLEFQLVVEKNGNGKQIKYIPVSQSMLNQKIQVSVVL